MEQWCYRHTIVCPSIVVLDSIMLPAPGRRGQRYDFLVASSKLGWSDFEMAVD